MKIKLMIIILLLFSSLSYAQEGSVTINEITYSNVQKIEFEWTAGLWGYVRGISTESSFTGQILEFATIPSGFTKPDDNYDITILDNNKLDVLLGQGADRDQYDTEYVSSSCLGVVTESVLGLYISNTGAGGVSPEGKVYLWIR